MPSGDLVLCAGCVRHARPRGACPFCGAPLPASPPDRPRWIGRLTRAAIFYGASALACSEPSPPPGEAPEAEAPEARAAEAQAAVPEPPSAPAEAVVPVEPEPVLAEDPAITAAERAHAEDAKRRRRAAERTRRIVYHPPPPLDPNLVAPPYGAPPFDFPV